MASSFLSPDSELRFALRFLPRSKSLWVGAALLNLMKTLPFYLFPLLVKLVLDHYIPSHDGVGIGWVFAAAVFLGFLNVFFHTAYHPAAHALLIRRTAVNVQLAMVRKLQRIEQSYLDLRESGRLFSKLVVSVNRISNFLGTLLDAVFSPLVAGALGLVVLLSVKWQLGLSLLLLVPVAVGLNHLFRNKLRVHQHAARVANEDFSQAVTLFIQTSKLTRVHGEEDFENAKVNVENQHLVEVSRGVIAHSALFTASTHITTQILLLAVAAVGSVLVMRGQLLIGELLLFIQYMGVVTNALNSMVNQMPAYLEFKEAVSAVREVLDHPVDEPGSDPDDRVRFRPSSLEGSFEVRGVSFSYKGKEEPVLREVDVSIPRGKTVAFVGESGSGKSTLLRLLLGLYEPTRGEILVDGRPLSGVHLRTLRGFFGVVSQDTILFPGTLQDNVTHGRPVTSMNDVMEALRRAHAYDFVMALPEKLDTRVEENGRNFSGGQRQRLAIARALYRKPSVLILDEATSALDSDSEAQVQKAITGLLGEQTTLMVAHRLSTIFHADLILVFDRGRIVERGTHHELIDRKGEYARLLSIQSGLPLESLGSLKHD